MQTDFPKNISVVTRWCGVTYAHTLPPNSRQSDFSLHYSADEIAKLFLVGSVGSHESLKHFATLQVNPSTVESVRRIPIEILGVVVLEYL